MEKLKTLIRHYVGKAIKVAAAENKNWKQEMHKFLRNYRATPHCTTKIAPAKVLFGENIKTRLPEIIIPEDDDVTCENDLKAKQKMKIYADKKSKSCMIKEGDAVLIKQPKANKLTIPFNPKPYKVVSRKGSMITAKQGEQSITRNSSYFKPVITEEEENKEDKSDVEEEEELTKAEIGESTYEDITSDETTSEKFATQKTVTPNRKSSRVRKTLSHVKDFVRK